MKNRDNVLYNKAFNFSLKIISIYKKLVFKKKEFVMSKQLLRCSTSIGANLSEASEAQGLKDFVSKLYISLKEAKEAQYWINLLIHSNYLSKESGNDLMLELNQIIAMLTSSIKTCKLKLTP